MDIDFMLSDSLEVRINNGYNDLVPPAHLLLFRLLGQI
jgi:hypothetical protein